MGPAIPIGPMEHFEIWIIDYGVVKTNILYAWEYSGNDITE